MNRRDFFKTTGLGSATLATIPALAHALTLPESEHASLEPGDVPANPFSVLLQGTYKRVVRCPDLGLLLVDPCAGSYSTTKIYAVSGLPQDNREHADRGSRRDDCESRTAIGNFYVSIG